MEYRDKYNLILSYQKSKKGRLFILLSLLTVLTFIYLYLFLQWDIRKGIADYTDEHCQLGQECMVSLQEITPFDWDRAYIFSVGTSSKDIDKAIGIHYPYRDVGIKFIFIKENEIIYSKEYFPYPDYPGKNQLMPKFAHFKNSGEKYPEYYYLTKDNNNIFINKHHKTMWDDKIFYSIKPTNENQSEKGNPYQQ